MTQPTTAPVKRIELSRSQQFQNVLFGMGTLSHMIGAAWWYFGLCHYQWAKHRKLPGAPVTIELFGSDPEQGRDILNDYGIRSAYGLLEWKVIDNQVGLRFMLMVSKASFDYADNILFQHSGVSFNVMTNAGSKRGQGIRRPYVQRQASQQAQRPTQPAQARLGKTWR
jgi:hypothetical protein